MKRVDLSYDQLRRILALCVDNGIIRMKLSELLDGRIAEVSEMDLIELLKTSEIDSDVIRILSGKDTSEMDAIDGLEYLSGFFGYMRANKERLTGWLASIGLKEPKAVKPATK